jgi:hypothetical protein
VFTARAGAHLRTARKTTATARRVEEAGLDGEGRKRLLQHSFSSSRRRLAQRRPNAAVLPASSSLPAELATSNESERGEERLSGGLLGMACIHSCARRGVFIGQTAEGEGGQEVASVGALATCDEQHRARRPCSHAGGVLSRRRSTVGRCWRGHGSRQRAESRGRREGVLGVFFLFSSMTHGSGRGRGGWARPRRCPRAWLQGSSEQEQRCSQ